MAKSNNLTDFLTDVANAIRAKKGTTAKINPQDFSSEIASISSGGGGGESTVIVVSKGDVNFYDYDGTLLHSYTKDAFLALSALPDLPTREGLICQEWNYTLADAKEYVTSYGILDIGATYITYDGKTRLYIRIAADGRMTVPLYFSQTVANGVTIDWGDGSATQTFSTNGDVSATHTYEAIGDYAITLNVNSGILGFGHADANYCIMGMTKNNIERVYSNMLQKVEIGSSVTSISNYAFHYCSSLASVVIPNSVTSIGTYAFRVCSSLTSVVIPSKVTSIGSSTFFDCPSLASVVIPSKVTSIGTSMFYSCYSLTSVVIPSGVTSIGDEAFNNCRSLTSVVIPSKVTRISGYTFQSCYSLTSVVIPSSVTTISNYAFQYCQSLASVVIPSKVTSIGSSTFYQCYSLASIIIPSGVTKIDGAAFHSCYGMALYDFSACSSVPTLSYTSAFKGIPSDCKIVVPDSLYDTWKAATNWSTYASRIVKASEFNG